ncbi:MAG: glycosyltransferase family 4 protein [Pseudomonadota bacterium]
MPRPKRILYLQTEDWAFLLHRLPMSRAARDAGFEIHVATRIGDRLADIEAEGFTPHHIGWTRGSRSPFDTLSAARQIRGVIKDIKPAILHNVAIKPTLVGSIASLGLPHLGVINSIAGLGSAFLAKAPHKRAMAWGLGQSMRHLLNRQRVRTVVQNPDDEAFLLRLGVHADQIQRIAGSGVDTEFYQPMPEPAGPMTVTFVGRMLEDKGVRALVEAHRLLQERSKAPRLLLAGTPDPENPTSISKQELQAWNARDNIEWLGNVSDIRGLWRKSHIAVLPSRREGLPKSLLEAAACGRAMIASDAPGCREIAIEGKTALTHPVDDAEAIAAAIERLTNNNALRETFATAARQCVVEQFSEEIIGAQTVALYEDVMRQT